MNDILELTATEQASLLADGGLSALELTNMYLDRIALLDAKIHAFTYVAHRQARYAAQKWDKLRLRGQQPRSPLSGIPTGIKDLMFVRGMPTRFGSRSVPPILAVRDTPLVKGIRDAGMILAGKLATSEFGVLPVTEPDTHPPTRNPFHLDRSAGGSSGGSGAAVAASLLPLAEGSDGAGSIRIPSAAGHLVGFKASRGVVPYVAPVDTELRLGTAGPLARSVGDTAAFLDIMSAWPQNFASALNVPLPKGLQVSLSTESPICATVPEYQQAAERVAAILTEHAAAVVTPRPWIDIPVKDFMLLWQRMIANAPRLMEGRLQPVTAWIRSVGRGISKQTALATRIEHERNILQWFGKSDLWISPTMAIRPPLVGRWQVPSPEQSFLNVLGMGVYTAVANVSGQPAVTVPMGLCEEGLPIGVQILGRVGADAQVLQAARLIERVIGDFRRPAMMA